MSLEFVALIVVILCFSCCVVAISIRQDHLARRISRLESVRVVHTVYSDGPLLKSIEGTLDDIANRQRDAAADPRSAFRVKG